MDDQELQAAVLEHAAFLGIHPATEPELLALAKEALLAPVPPPWKQYENEQGVPYYVNEATGESSWENPMDEIYAEKVKAAKASKSAKSPASLPLPPLPPPTMTKTVLAVGAKQSHLTNEEDIEEDSIDRIVDKRVEGGVVEYKVHWMNSSADDDEWFPRDDLIDEFPDQVAAFESQKDALDKRKKASTSSVKKDALELPTVSHGMLESMRQTINELEDEVIDTRKKLMRAKEDCDRASRGERRAMREMEELMDSIGRLKEELEREGEENASLRRRTRSLQAEIHKLERQAVSSSGAPPAPVPSSVNPGEELAALRDELALVKSQHLALKEDYGAKERAVSRLEEDVSVLQTSLEKCKQELDREMQKTSQQRKQLMEAEVNSKTAEQRSEPDPEMMKEMEELRKRCNTSEEKVSQLRSERTSQKEQLGLMRTLLTQAQAELKTRAAQATELEEMIKTVRASADAKMNAAEKEKATEIENVVERRLQAARRVAESEISAIKEQMAGVEKKLVEEMVKRRALHNRVMELQGNIRVYCRSRPVSQIETKAGQENASVVVHFPEKDDGAVLVRARLESKEVRSAYEFDAGFNFASSQAQVFEKVHPFVISAMDGYNCCIFAYGQTGSGKTYTMEGPSADRGVNVRALESMFVEAEDREKRLGMKYTFTVTMCEIYQEDVYDLLPSKKNTAGHRTKIQLRQGPGKNGGVYAEGLNSVNVSTPEDVESLVKRGHQNRSVGAHNFNEHSSRSHLVITVQIMREVVKDGKNLVRTCSLNLIDLAGSERISKTDATGERLKEAQSINKSLSALGDVIGALGGNSKHVPYRNSKLTWLLSSSLSGNSKVLMFVCVSPTLMCTSETLCSLNFAQRCRSTELGKAAKASEGESHRGIRRGGGLHH